MTRLAALWCAVAVAGAVFAEESMPPPVPVTPMPVASSEVSEPSRVLTTRWQVRPWVGGTTLRLGGLEQFPAASTVRFERNWASAYGAVVDDRSETLLDLGLVHGADASFRLDPLVSVSARVALLESGRGGRVTRMSSGADTFRDEWDFSTSMLLVAGGAGFHLPLAAKTRLNVSLFVGTGLAEVRIGHRQRLRVGGSDYFSEASVEAEGTSFIPEFAFELEHDVTESLGLGAALGYRFGGIESFTVRHATMINLVYNGIEADDGRPLRNADRALLTADYGGLVLAVYLSARM